MESKHQELLEMYKELNLNDKESLMRFLIRDCIVWIEFKGTGKRMFSICEDIKDVCQNGTMLQLELKEKINLKKYIGYVE